MHARARLLALALLAAALAPRPAAAQGGAGTLAIRPAAVTVGVGQSATVEVWLEGAVGYYGLELRLECDPALVDVQVAPRWEVVSAASHIVVKSQAGWCDDRSGHRWYGAWYAAANVSPASAFSGSGRLCAITLTGLAPGAGALHIALAEGGTDTGGTLRPATADGALLVARLTATPTPSATPSPSASPTPSPTRAATPAAHATPPALLPAAGVTPTPRSRLAAATPTPTATPSPSPTRRPGPVTQPGAGPTVPPAQGAPTRAGPLLTLLLPFLLGATLTAAALRLRRRR